MTTIHATTGQTHAPTHPLTHPHLASYNPQHNRNRSQQYGNDGNKLIPGTGCLSTFLPCASLCPSPPPRYSSRRSPMIGESRLVMSFSHTTAERGVLWWGVRSSSTSSTGSEAVCVCLACSHSEDSGRAVQQGLARGERRSAEHHSELHRGCQGKGQGEGDGWGKESSHACDAPNGSMLTAQRFQMMLLPVIEMTVRNQS